MNGTIAAITEPFGKILTLQIGPNTIVGECIQKEADGLYVIKDLNEKKYHFVLPKAMVLRIHN